MGAGEGSDDRDSPGHGGTADQALSRAGLGSGGRTDDPLDFPILDFIEDVGAPFPRIGHSFTGNLIPAVTCSPSPPLPGF